MTRKAQHAVGGWAMVGAVLMFVSVLAAQSLPKLPADLTMRSSGDSPGAVTFSHASHVDQARPDCTSCHPKLFSILPQQAGQKRAALTHDAMTKGAACGACHDGKKAFAFEDDCTFCHKES